MRAQDSHQSSGPDSATLRSSTKSPLGADFTQSRNSPRQDHCRRGEGFQPMCHVARHWSWGYQFALGITEMQEYMKVTQTSHRLYMAYPADTSMFCPCRQQRVKQKRLVSKLQGWRGSQTATHCHAPVRQEADSHPRNIIDGSDTPQRRSILNLLVLLIREPRRPVCLHQPGRDAVDCDVLVCKRGGQTGGEMDRR